MPPSARRTRARRETNVQEHSDVDNPESIQTPSRKRRRVNTQPNTPSNSKPTKNNAQRAGSAESTDTVDLQEEESSDAREDLEFRVISKLKVAGHTVNVCRDYNNVISQPGSRPAFAKLAGNNWTYLLNKAEIAIGRPDAAQVAKGTGAEEAENEGGEAHDANGVNSSSNITQKIDVDLGPDRAVSRVHANIYYDADSTNWLIFVNGRNGLKLDDYMVPRGSRVQLHSGSVISINGTQMLFVLPQSELLLSPSIREQVGIVSEDESDGELGQHKNARRGPQNGGARGGRGRLSGDGKPEAFGGNDAADRGKQQSSQHNRRVSGGTHTFSQSGHPAAAAAAAGRYTPATPTGGGLNEFQIKTSGSPTYARGMKMESTEQIDYSLDANKDVKPPFSYAQIIGQAILGAPEEQISLNDIYEFMRRNFAFFRHSNEKWPNSIRHNLSLNKAFHKVPRKLDDPGKGNKWTIVPEHREEFLKKGLTTARRAPIRRADSGPNSPAGLPNNHTLSATGQQHNVAASPSKLSQANPNASGLSSSQQKDNALSYPVAHESFTPDRGPRRSNRNNGDENPQWSHDSVAAGAWDGAQMTPDRPAQGQRGMPGQSQEQPTPLTNRKSGLSFSLSPSEATPTQPTRHPASSASVYNSSSTTGDFGPGGGSLQTPFISRQHPRLAPPSAAVLPSQFITLSSPAPFWKFAEMNTPHNANSTREGWSEGSELDVVAGSPAINRAAARGVQRPLGEPIKSEDNDGDETMVDADATLPPQPSSPPAIPMDQDQDQDQDPGLDELAHKPDSNPANRGNSNLLPTPADVDDSNNNINDTQTIGEDLSPSRTISRPVSQRDPAGKSSTTTGAPMPPLSAAPASLRQSQLGPHGGSFGAVVAAKNGADDNGDDDEDDDDDEEGAIDLAKGFQPIGSFHRSMARGASITGS